MSLSHVNLYLVGFMGTGKSTIGRAAASRLGFELLDSDTEIERKMGTSVADIFEKRGEAAFRSLERDFIESGHAAERHVVACGGGLIVQPGMLELVKSRGVVICLHASLDTILKRTSGTSARPLLNVEDPSKRLAELYAQREQIYRRSGTMVLTDARPFNDIVNHVLRIYQREAAEWKKA